MEIKEFWETYAKVNEIEQSKMLDTLTLFQTKREDKLILTSKTLIKSYFDDIIESLSKTQAKS